MAAQGVRWGIIVSVATQLGRVVFLLAVLRLIGPRNAGIVAQALLVVAIAQIFVHLGLAASIVQRPKLVHGEVGSAFWLNLATGFLLAALIALAAPLLAGFFRTEELVAVLHVLSISFVLRAMTIVPSALLTRDMRFRSLGIVEVVSTFICGAIGLAAAMMGAGYWSLVFLTVARDASYLLLITWVNGLPDVTWSTAAARNLWSFGSRLMGADLVNYVSGNTDKFLVARFLGPTQLGLYSLAFRVLELAMSMAAQVGRVVLPTFAHLQDDRERLARVFLNVTEIISLAICPAMTFAILVAPVAVPAIFGEAWAEAVVLVQLISAMTIPYFLLSCMGPLTVAVGRSDWEFQWSLIAMVAQFVVLPVGLLWGVAGVATSYLLVITALCPIRFVIVQRLVPLSARGYVRALAPASSSTVALVAAWWLTDALLQSATGEPITVMAASVAAAAAYLAAFRIGWPEDFRRQLDLALLIVGGRRT
jgi:PST family polysaccharide transporter